MKKFNLYFAVLSVFVDLTAIIIGLVLAYEIRAQGNVLYLWPFSSYILFVGKFLPIWLLLLASQGLYNIRSLPTGWNALGRLVIGLLSGWGVMLITLYLSRSPESLVFPRLVIAYGMLLTIVFAFLGRFLLKVFKRVLNRFNVGLIRTVVVTNNSDDRFIAELTKPVHARHIVGIIKQNYIDELERLRLRGGIDEIIVASEELDEHYLLSILEWAENHGINLGQVPSLLFVRATNIDFGTLGGKPIMFYRRTPLEGWGRVYKRVLDVLIVAPAIIILSPIYLLFAILVKISSPGPVLYQHDRVGQDGRIFKIRKFRSMYVNAEHEHNITWSANESKDPRITPLGRLMRKTDLDELPQLWDILVGKMSLVGPRPEQPSYVEKFAKEYPQYIRRHHVKSGLTGWAQVNGLRGDTSISERVKYDLFYIEHWSIWFDLRIIGSTIMMIVRKVFGL